MKIESLGRQEVKETRRGVYLWRLPNGRFISDGDGHYLMIESMEGDQERMKALAKAAHDCGVDEGMPCFFRGNRIVTDEEYEEQKLRLKFGLTPDPLDILSINEDRQNERNRRR